MFLPLKKKKWEKKITFLNSTLESEKRTEEQCLGHSGPLCRCFYPTWYVVKKRKNVSWHASKIKTFIQRKWRVFFLIKKKKDVTKKKMTKKKSKKFLLQSGEKPKLDKSKHFFLLKKKVLNPRSFFAFLLGFVCTVSKKQKSWEKL